MNNDLNSITNKSLYPLEIDDLSYQNSRSTFVTNNPLELKMNQNIISKIFNYTYLTKNINNEDNLFAITPSF